MSPIQVTAEVASLRPAGAYYHLTLIAPTVATRTRPGQFVALSVGGAESALLLRRSFSVYRASADGAHGGTVEIVFADVGRGTRWLAQVRPGTRIDLVGPLGRPFALPREQVACALVGGGYGSAPLFLAAQGLARRGCRAHFVLGAATRDRVFGTHEAEQTGASVAVTTEDGSAGARGRVTDALPELLHREGIEVVYACGPMGMLAAVSALCSRVGIYCQCAVEESMACGIGVCMTCVLPVVGEDGTTRMVRSCTQGPVFWGDRVRWGDVGTIPPDTLGAPVPDRGAAS